MDGLNEMDEMMEEGEEEEEEEVAPEPEPEPEPPKKPKVQIWPGLRGPSPDNTYLSKLPTVPAAAVPYQPILYTFRTVRHPFTACAIRTKILPFHIQFDHTIAVIWAIFNKEPLDAPRFGLNQLIWALNFLRTCRNDGGSYANDIRMCIDTIHNFIIDYYTLLLRKVNDFGRLKDLVPEPERPFSINYTEMLERCSRLSAAITAKDAINDDSLLGALEAIDNMISVLLDKYCGSACNLND